ncbi:PHD-finger [Ancylostoma caninum]|uniref:PHD-finger n=1 Tax=Ancylostoma caninum TaxID=29170 RepID=A0A368GCS8_ANCCA|nr:PHD-finger [Ancylostoma caninum]
MPGAVYPVTERAPSLRISLRKKAMAQAQEAEVASATPTPRSTRKNQAKKRGRPAGTKAKAASASKSQSDTKVRTSAKGRSSRSKHSKPWEYDDGEDQHCDYISCSESESSSSEEEYSFKASQSNVQFLEDEADDDCITNDESFHPSEEDIGECARLSWVELSSTDIPPFELPESSKDIPIPVEYLLDTVELYELLRSYWRTLRLTPFLFEDFCAALLSSDNSCLLSEIHIVLIRMCFKNDDEEQVHFSGNETNNAYNIVTACLEPMTYAEVLRQYLSSDTTVPSEVMEAVNAPNYPFVGFSARLVLITFLSYRFLYSNEYKKLVVASNGKIEHEETCRSCCKNGDLLQCNTCEAVFHPACVELDSHPNEWTCDLCEKSKVRGVQDCLPLNESTSKQPLRMEPIGRDRHGRFYWFVARRIFVHNMDESDLRYYSTAPQFYQLFRRMDPSFYEFDLCNVFYERLSDILEQMSVTLELSSDRRDTIYRENYNTSKSLPAESADGKLASPKDSEMKGEEEEEQKPFATLDDCFKTMLGFSGGRLVNNFWSGNVEESELLQYKATSDSDGNVTRPDPSKLFRMGNPNDDPNFSKYTNLFVSHKHGEHPTTKKKNIDKKKYLCTKFSLMEEGEWTFEELEQPNTSWTKLRELLLRLECGMRRTLFLPQWWNNLGHTRLTRTTVEDRERMMKEAQRRKKEEREAIDAVDEDIIIVKHTKLPHGVSKELTRMRDEKYRVYGRGELGGWLWISRTLVRDIREIPGPYCIKKEEQEANGVNKSPRIDVIASKLMQWRSQQEAAKKKKNCVCYSPSCRMGIPSRSVCSNDEMAGYQSCYSQECRQKQLDLDGLLDLNPCFASSCPSTSTSAVAKAYDPLKVPEPRKGVLGEDLPWPLPEVNHFLTKGSKRTSIFVLPQATLRRLAKTGGRKAIYVPSFSATAKGNLQYWNYPTPRPCFDLCWRWLTVNCASLHAVALQLRILWASVRWQDMKPEDDDPDRRIVLHFPDRDERRWISSHKEYAPPCIYERYRLSIEVLPLDDDKEIEEEDDLSWTSDGICVPKELVYKCNNVVPITAIIGKETSVRSSTPVDAASVRRAVSVQDRIRQPPPQPVRHSTVPQTDLRHAPVFISERKRKPTQISDYEYYSPGPDEEGDEVREDGSELTGWEPRAAKRPRPAPRMDSTRLLQTLTPSSRVVPGRQYQVGVLRGGGRVVQQPVGDGMQPAGLLEESVVPLGAEEEIVTTDQTEAKPLRHVPRVVGNGKIQDSPPVMSRYENAGVNYAGHTVSRVLSPASRARAIHATTTTSRPSVAGAGGGGKLLMVRRSDGTTQFLRQIHQGGEEAVAAPLATVRTRTPQNIRTVAGSRIVHSVAGRDQDQPTSTLLVPAHAVETATVRAGFEQTVDPFMKRMAVEKAASGPVTTSQGVVRRQIARPSEVYEEVYYEPSDVKERVVYTDGVRPITARPVNRLPQPYGYAQNSGFARTAVRNSVPVVGGRAQPSANAQRVYYVKNAVTMVPSRVVLAPAPVETYVQDEVVFDNGDYVIDGGEIPNNSGAHMS